MLRIFPILGHPQSDYSVACMICPVKCMHLSSVTTVTSPLHDSEVWHAAMLYAGSTSEGGCQVDAAAWMRHHRNHVCIAAGAHHHNKAGLV